MVPFLQLSGLSASLPDTHPRSSFLPSRLFRSDRSFPPGKGDQRDRGGAPHRAPHRVISWERVDQIEKGSPGRTESIRQFESAIRRPKVSGVPVSAGKVP